MVGMEVNTHYAKTHLSRLIEKAMLGEEVVIARAGKPVAKLVRIGADGRKRILGSAKGTIWYAKDWDAPMTVKEFEEFIGG